MSATLAPTALPAPAAAPARPLTLVEPAAGAADADLRRWLVGLGTPFVLGAIFFALSVAVADWLIGASLVFGPVLFMFATIYLCISSDSNAELPPPS
jgi:hypothetical protein